MKTYLPLCFFAVAEEDHFQQHAPETRCCHIHSMFFFFLLFPGHQNAWSKQLHLSLMQSSDASVNEAWHCAWWQTAARDLALSFASVNGNFLELCLTCTEIWGECDFSESKAAQFTPKTFNHQSEGHGRHFYFNPKSRDSGLLLSLWFVKELHWIKFSQK